MKLIKQLHENQIITSAKRREYQNVTFSKGFVNFMESLVNSQLINEDYKRKSTTSGIQWCNCLLNNGIILETTENAITSSIKYAGNMIITGNKESLDLVESLLVLNEVEYSGKTKPEDIHVKIEYHDHLNPILWEDNDTLHNDVLEALFDISQAFFTFLEMSELTVQDITITGSSANFNWTKDSDIDLHLLVDVSETEEKYGALVGQYFDAQRKVWNDMHDISIKGIPVEVYVQDTAEKHFSTGIYSIQREEWIEHPTKDKPSLDHIAIKTKAAHLMDEIDDVLKSDNPTKLDNMMAKLTKMRKAGLEEAGEFSTENYAYKVLRNAGYIDKLANSRTTAIDDELSLEDEEDVNSPWEDIGYTKKQPIKTKPTTIEKRTRINLNVPYSQRNSAKRAGAKWDPGIRKWYMNVTNEELKRIPNAWR